MFSLNTLCSSKSIYCFLPIKKKKKNFLATKQRRRIRVREGGVTVEMSSVKATSTRVIEQRVELSFTDFASLEGLFWMRTPNCREL